MGTTRYLIKHAGIANFRMLRHHPGLMQWISYLCKPMRYDLTLRGNPLSGFYNPDSVGIQKKSPESD
jgi:hypothetical protein